MYERPDIPKSETPHPLFQEFGIHGVLRDGDPGWFEQVLAPLHDDGRYVLSTMVKVIERYEEMPAELKELKPEIAEEKRMAIINEARITAYSFYKKHVETAERTLEAASQMIYDLTEPDKRLKSQGEQIAQGQREAALWQWFLTLDPKIRIDAIRGDQEKIMAAVSCPFPFIEESALKKLRRDYAFDHAPDLFNQEADKQHLLDAVKRRAGQVNGTIVKMLIGKNIPVDEIDPELHFSIFKPNGRFEQARAEQRIREFKRKSEALRLKKERIEADKAGLEEAKLDTSVNDLSDIPRKAAKKDESKSRPHKMPKAAKRRARA